jgi:hypothetical protein
MAKLAADIEEQIDRAIAEARDLLPSEVAVEARFDPATNMLIFVLGNGRRFAIPREDMQHLADASDEDVAQVEIEMLGTALHWEKLDVDFSIKGLMEGRTGNQHWMRYLEQRRQDNAVAALSKTA